MFEVLMYIFENYMNGSVTLNADLDTVANELEVIGFERGEISRALDWLEGLNRAQEMLKMNRQSTLHAMRHYDAEESERLLLEGKSFLLHLEQLKILDPATREVVMDRFMALDRRDVDLGRLKWIVLIALFNQPDKKAALTLLQDMILADAFNVLH
jgi:Smg protein